MEEECGLAELYGTPSITVPQVIKPPEEWSWQWLERQPYGTAMWDLMLANHEPVVGFMVRESQADIETIAKTPPYFAEWRAISLGHTVKGRRVMPVVVLIWFFELNTIYETWFNFYGSGKEVQKALMILGKQPLLLLFFYDQGPKALRSLAFENDIAFFFHAHYGILKALPWWSDDDFNEAKRQLMERYTTDDLWTMK